MHFEDRNAFVDALHARFHDRVEERVGEATAGLPLGPIRLLAGVEAYLDTCLPDRAVKALALEARSDPDLAAAMSARHERFAGLRSSEHQGDGLARCNRRLAPVRGDDSRDRDP